MSASTVQEKKVFGSLKYEEWPQIDRDLMQAASAPKAFLRPGGPASSWRQTTCETVFYRYGVFPVVAARE
jgi:hypothetical protein